MNFFGDQTILVALCAIPLSDITRTLLADLDTSLATWKRDVALRFCQYDVLPE